MNELESRSGAHETDDIAEDKQPRMECNGYDLAQVTGQVAPDRYIHSVTSVFFGPSTGGIP